MNLFKGHNIGIKKTYILFGTVKGILIYFLYSIVTFPAAILIRNKNIEQRYVPGFWTEELYCISSFLFSLVFFFSLVSIFTLFDKTYREEFAEKATADSGFLFRCKFILTSNIYWFETLSIALLITFIPYITPFSEFLYGFFGEYEFSFIQENLIIIASIIPIFSVIIFLGHISTVNWWQRLLLKKNLHKDKRSIFRLVVQLLYTSVIYVVAAATLCIVIPMIATMFIVVRYILLAFFTFVVIFFLSLFLIMYGKAFLVRRKFINRLKKLCDQYRYKLTNITSIYKSTIFSDNGINFVISTDKSTYKCKLIFCNRRKKSLYFRDCGEVYYNSSFLNLINHTTSFSYFFDDRSFTGRESKKIIIVCPEVAALYATDDVTDRRIYSGDSVMGYTVYQSSEFLGSLDRRCL